MAIAKVNSKIMPVLVLGILCSALIGCNDPNVRFKVDKDLLALAVTTPTPAQSHCKFAGREYVLGAETTAYKKSVSDNCQEDQVKLTCKEEGFPAGTLSLYPFCVKEICEKNLVSFIADPNKAGDPQGQYELEYLLQSNLSQEKKEACIKIDPKQLVWQPQSISNSIYLRADVTSCACVSQPTVCPVDQAFDFVKGMCATCSAGTGWIPAQGAQLAGCTQCKLMTPALVPLSETLAGCGFQIITSVEPAEAAKKIECDTNPVPKAANSICVYGEVDSKYKFKEWSVTSPSSPDVNMNCSNNNGDSACILKSINDNLKVVAKFEVKTDSVDSPQFTIVASKDTDDNEAGDKSGGLLMLASCSPERVSFGGKSECKAESYHPNYSFASWGKDGDLTFNTKTPSLSVSDVKSNEKYIAHFARKTVDLTMVADTPNSGTITCSPVRPNTQSVTNPDGSVKVVVNSGEKVSCTAKVADARKMVLDTWSGCLVSDKNCWIENLSASTTITAKFKPLPPDSVSFEIGTEPAGVGVVTCLTGTTPITTSLVKGLAYSCRVDESKTNIIYKFAGWQGSCLKAGSNSVCTNSNVQLPQTITAKFELQKFTITTKSFIDTQVGTPAVGHVNCTKTSLTGLDSTSCTAITSDVNLYKFKSWSNSECSEYTGNACSFVPSKNTEVVANFECVTPSELKNITASAASATGSVYGSSPFALDSDAGKIATYLEGKPGAKYNLAWSNVKYLKSFASSLKNEITTLARTTPFCGGNMVATRIPAVPGIPRNLKDLSNSSTAANTVSITFDAPVDDGGQPIANYTLNCTNADGTTSKSITGTSAPLVLTGLDAKLDVSNIKPKYACFVTASSIIGQSAPSPSLTVSVLPESLRIKVTKAGTSDGTLVLNYNPNSFPIGWGSTELTLQKGYSLSLTANAQPILSGISPNAQTEEVLLSGGGCAAQSSPSEVKCATQALQGQQEIVVTYKKVLYVEAFGSDVFFNKKDIPTEASAMATCATSSAKYCVWGQTQMYPVQVTLLGGGSGTVTSTGFDKNLQGCVTGEAPPKNCEAAIAKTLSKQITFSSSAEVNWAVKDSNGVLLASQPCSTLSAQCVFSVNQKGLQVTATFTKPVTARCGFAQGASFEFAPTQNLCSTASPLSGTVKGDTISWSWQCKDASSTKDCTAVRTYSLSVTPPSSVQGSISSDSGQIANCGLSGGICSSKFEYNKQVILTASPKDGYALSGWAGGCQNSNSASTTTTCIVNMDQAKLITATFSEINFPLTVVPGKLKVTVYTNPRTPCVATPAAPTCLINVKKDTVVIMDAEAVEAADGFYRYQPTSWSGGNGSAVTNSSPNIKTYSVKVDGPKTATANFESFVKLQKVASSESGGNTPFRVVGTSQDSEYRCGNNGSYTNCGSSWVKAGNSITLSAENLNSWQVVHWAVTSLDAASTNSATQTVACANQVNQLQACVSTIKMDQPQSITPAAKQRRSISLKSYYITEMSIGESYRTLYPAVTSDVISSFSWTITPISDYNYYGARSRRTELDASIDVITLQAPATMLKDGTRSVFKEWQGCSTSTPLAKEYCVLDFTKGSSVSLQAIYTPIVSNLISIWVHGSGEYPSGVSVPNRYTKLTSGAMGTIGGTVKTKDGTIDCGPNSTNCTGSFAYLDDVSFTITPMPGYQFEELGQYQRYIEYRDENTDYWYTKDSENEFLHGIGLPAIGPLGCLFNVTKNGSCNATISERRAYFAAIFKKMGEIGVKADWRDATSGFNGEAGEIFKANLNLGITSKMISGVSSCNLPQNQTDWWSKEQTGSTIGTTNYYRLIPKNEGCTWFFSLDNSTLGSNNQIVVKEIGGTATYKLSRCENGELVATSTERGCKVKFTGDGIIWLNFVFSKIN